MPISCTVDDLEAMAAALRGMSEGAREAANTYLLAVAAGVDPDPDSISELSACFRCVPEQKLNEMQAYLTCIAGGGVAPPTDCSSLSGAGDPTGVTTPDFSGQLYHDTDADSYYRSTGATSADWTAIIGGASRGGDTFGLFTYGDSGAVGAQVITDTTNAAGYDIEFTPGITSLSWPNLVSIDPTNTQGGYLSIQGNDGLTSVNISALQTVASGVSILSNSALTSISSAALISAGSVSVASNNLSSLILTSLTTAPNGNFNAANNSALTTVSIPAFVPTNTKSVLFSGCALTLASVNHILARCVANAGYVSGTVDLSGGTSAAPSGQGATDKTTLTGRGVTVNTN